MSAEGIAPVGQSSTTRDHRWMHVCGLMICYVVVLHVAYVQMIAPMYSYLGFAYRTPNYVSYTIVVLLVIVLACLMPRTMDRPSVVVLWIEFGIATVPSMLVPQFTPVVPIDTAFLFALFVGGFWWMVLVLTSGRFKLKIRIRRRAKGTGSWLVAITMISLFVDFVLSFVVGFRFQLATLIDVADVRFGYRDALAGAPFGTAYLLLGTCNVLNPVLMMRGLAMRKFTPLAVGLIGQVYIYAVTGYKTILLSVPVIIAAYFWLKRRKAADALVIPRGVVGVMAVSWGSFAIFGWTTLSLLFVLRFIAAPGNLVAGYIHVFSGRDQLYWSYSFMGWLFEYPYQVNPNFLVGELLRGSSLTSANVNMFGDGFMNMRWAGIGLECLVLVAALWVLDSVAKNLSIATVFSALLIPSFDLANTAVFTALTTHGLLLAMVVLAMAPAEYGTEQDSDPPNAVTRRADKNGRTTGRPRRT